MNWIKENKFAAGLGGATLVLTLVLAWLGMKSGDRYEAAQKEYQDALSEAKGFEKLVPYPTQENLAAKKVALGKYAEQTAKLQEAFEPFRPGELTNISPQDFSDKLNAAREETLKAFGDATTVPEDYFMGFEFYRSRQASGAATGILVYQLEAVKQMMFDMASAGVSKLVNIHRPRLEEEDGRKFEPEDGQVARELPLELTFRGPESAIRQFLSTIVNDDDRFIVVRSLSIRNSKLTPPNADQASFDRAAPAAAAAPAADASPQFGAVNLNSFLGADGGADEEAAEPEVAPAAPVDSSRILSQVLGNEEVTVFVRLDILGFLEPVELP